MGKDYRSRLNTGRKGLGLLKIILQSHDRFDDFAEFSPSDNRLTVFSKRQELTKWTGRSQGWYGTVNQNPAVLFNDNRNLYFFYKGATIPIQENTHAGIQVRGRERNFSLTRDGKPILSIPYVVPQQSVPPELDFTDTAPEDFDFLLFVKNILGDPARRKFAMGMELA